MKIQAQTLDIEKFKEFGSIIACENQLPRMINQGNTQRFHALSEINIKGEGYAGISIFRNIKGVNISREIPILMLEKHVHTSQAFIPLARQPFLIVVARSNDQGLPDIDNIFAFLSNGEQGINYLPNIWHHPLVTLEDNSDFLVLDRITTEEDCEIYLLPEGIYLSATQ